MAQSKPRFVKGIISRINAFETFWTKFFRTKFFYHNIFVQRPKGEFSETDLEVMLLLL